MKAHAYLLSGEINNNSINELIKYIFEIIHKEKNPKFILYISSTGGDIDSAIRFYDFIKATNADVITVGFSQVDSSATTVLLAGTHRLALKNTRFRIHEPMFNGKTYPVSIDTYQEVYGFFKTMKNRYFEIIAQELHKDKKELEKLYKQGKIFSAEEALEIGYVHNIIEKFPVTQILSES